MAHHNWGLTLRELITAIKRLLSDEGSFAILLPYHRTQELEKMANREGFFVQKQIRIKQTVNHSFFRSINLFSTYKDSFTQDEICIKDENNNYTNEFNFFIERLLPAFINASF